MENFISVKDVTNISALVNEALELKKNPFAHSELGKNKTLGLIFLNPSLRTRLSTQKAALNLGMNVMVMNMDKEGWALETQDGVIMNHNTVEHIREAAAVMGEYCDIIGVRSFPRLVDQHEDYSEDFFNKFIKYAGVPIVSLESATLHPLQSLADLVTIEENVIMGGAGSAVLESLGAQGINMAVLQLGLPDAFVEHGDPAVLLADCGLNKDGIVKSVQSWLLRKTEARMSHKVAS